MNLRIQRPIGGLAYSVNEQTIDTNGLTKEEVIAQIQQAKDYGDHIQNIYGQPSSVADFQLISEFNELKKVLDKVQTTSEQKSVMLEAFKKALGDEQYTAIKEATISSPHFKKITLHSKESE